MSSITNEELKKVLERARELVSLGWCQGDLAQDEFGSTIPDSSPNAKSFCTIGAIDRALYEALEWNWNMVITQPLAPKSVMLKDLYNATKIELLKALGIKDPVAHSFGIVSFNDKPGRTQEQVIELFDNAIANMKRRLA